MGPRLRGDDTLCLRSDACALAGTILVVALGGRGWSVPARDAEWVAAARCERAACDGAAREA
jgi:hypothetical protein